VIARIISNRDDIIDSRDVIERIEELESLLQDVAEDGGDTEGHYDDDRDELAALKALAEEGYLYVPDWKYGAALIRDSYFEEYAEEFAHDIGAIDRGAGYGWPLTHLDWAAAAAALKMDFIELEFDGVTYWARS
jgi:hypothetical protein